MSDLVAAILPVKTCIAWCQSARALASSALVTASRNADRLVIRRTAPLGSTKLTC